MTEPRRPSPFEVAAAVVDGTADIVALWKGRPPIWFVPTSCQVGTVLGLTEVELAERQLAEIVHPEDVARIRQALDGLLAQPGARTTVRYRARHRSGRYVELESTAVNRMGDAVVSAVVVHTRELPAEPIASLHVDDTDPGGERLPFIVALQEAIQQKQARFWRLPRLERGLIRDRRHDFSVMLVELDRYKMLLGTLGADAINAMLTELGKRIRVALRRQDLLAYLGAGDFGILLRGEQTVGIVDRISERVQAAVEELKRAGGHEVAVSATIGIVTSERPYENSEDVMRDASAAVARARQARSRRRAVFATEMRAEDRQLVTMLGEIRTAVELNELMLYYQPIVGLVSGEILGFEALIRWNHPRRGILAPGAFLPVAEQSGVIRSIGDWVMHEACRQMAEWNETLVGTSSISVSINLSPSEFGDGLRERIEQTLRATNLPPQQLRLEVTEHAVLGDRELAAKALAMLQLYGVQVSLDDFGTGYASFGYLLDLPLDTVKIDRSFTIHAGHKDARGAIVEAIVNLAHTLGMKVVAEGVETAEQVAAVKQLGCDAVQGYYYCRPVPAAEARELIRSARKW